MNQLITIKLVSLLKFDYSAILSDIEDKRGLKRFIIQICVIWGLLLFVSKKSLNNEFFDQVKIPKNSEMVILIVSGLLVSIGMIIFSYIIFRLVSVIMSYKIENFTLWKISCYGVLPNIIGGFFNVLLIAFFGVNNSGYTSLYSIFQPANIYLANLMQQLNPFSILGYLLMTYLFWNIIKKNNDVKLHFIHYFIGLEILIYVVGLF